jgi:hypothetical protein
MCLAAFILATEYIPGWAVAFTLIVSLRSLLLSIPVWLTGWCLGQSCCRWAPEGLLNEAD